ERRVDIEQSLHVVVARGKLGEAGERVTVGAPVDDRGGARSQPLDVLAEERLRGILPARFAELEARLRRPLAGDDDEDAPIRGLGPDRRRERELEAQADRRLVGAGRPRPQDREGQKAQDDSPNIISHYEEKSLFIM